MLLKSLTITDFRCFANVHPVPMHRLTVFIGENDSGKTAILDTLEILLTDRKPSTSEPSDFRVSPDGEVADTIVIGGIFELDDHDTIPDDYRATDGHRLVLTKTFTASSISCEVQGRSFADPRWNDFVRQSAAVQKELLQTLEIAPGRNAAERRAQFDEAVSTGALTKVAATVEIRFADIADHLPRFERVASTEYRHPDTMVQRTLQAVVDSFLRPQNPETGERELLPELQDIKSRIKDALDAKLKQMLDTLRTTNPRLISAEVSPGIDFSRSVTATNLMLDTGQGPRLVDSFGEGTKKKLWMGLLDWERQTQRELQDIPTIRAYDEPDVNLDYAAERKLFAGIIDATRGPERRTQAVVCTHTLTLIDRAPAKSVNLIKADEGGARSIEYVSDDADEEVESFLSTIGRSVGLTNSALFYERAYLVVEGESEENALPILYRNLYGRSIIEDGIVLVPLLCGAWKAILKVLLRYKIDGTVMLLDQDCTTPGSGVRVTPEALAEAGYPAQFLTTSCFFIGDREFEDAFRTADIAAVLNSVWPKEDSTTWTEAEIDRFRDPACKFSDDLMRCVRRTCVKCQRRLARKPEFAEKLARHCSTSAQIPQPIRLVFEELRVRSGCNVP